MPVETFRGTASQRNQKNQNPRHNNKNRTKNIQPQFGGRPSAGTLGSPSFSSCIWMRNTGEKRQDRGARSTKYTRRGVPACSTPGRRDMCTECGVQCPACNVGGWQHVSLRGGCRCRTQSSVLQVPVSMYMYCCHPMQLRFQEILIPQAPRHRAPWDPGPRLDPPPATLRTDYEYVRVLRTVLRTSSSVFYVSPSC